MKMINFALVESVSIRTDRIIVNVRRDSGTTADVVLMLTNVKFKMEIVKNSASIPKVSRTLHNGDSLMTDYTVTHQAYS